MPLKKILQLAILTALTVLPAIGPAANAQPQDRKWNCGFVRVNPQTHDGVGSRYTHCGDSFILVRVDWSTGGGYNECVEPWGVKSYWEYTAVANVYYIPRTPNLLQLTNGQRTCSLSQPN
ncbi:MULTISPECIES: DUF6355 family natural product biosynthesis protein [Actinosynnema]|uniref:DUF6355 family natural product biosynthesis protein n=1 Tax=Actinosynnema TaxID=40566 RepID=UPI0020A2D09C|nr:DUF6355 family natural product biosynthesis protein [Actinosynnema pretiosum]MCP2095559.1 hypothetical protein [Actinosynnema pretiosum]